MHIRALDNPWDGYDASTVKQKGCKSKISLTDGLYMNCAQLWALLAGFPNSHMPRDACCSGSIIDCDQTCKVHKQQPLQIIARHR
jgi:hypothetical protein